MRTKKLYSMLRDGSVASATGIALLAALSLASATTHASETLINLPTEAANPESLGYDTQTGTLYIGSAGNGSIWARSQKGEISLFQRAGRDGRHKTLGVKVDSPRRRLWVVDGASVYTYSLKDFKLLKKSTVADPAETLVNDLAFDRHGNAFITDSFKPVLYRVDARTLEMKVHADLSGIPYGKQNDLPYNLNGIVLTPSGKHAIAVKTNDGTLWKISLKSGKFQQVPTTEPVTMGDGLAWGSKGDLYVIRNFNNKVSKVRLAGRPPFQVTDISVSSLNIPTGAVYLRGKSPRLIVTNSQFGVETPTVPFQLVEIAR